MPSHVCARLVRFVWLISIRLPYVAQGAAQCLEDAAVFAECFSLTDDIPFALSMYETSRKERAERIQQSASDVSNVIHLPDGPQQEARDARYMAKSQSHQSDKYVDADWQDFMYGVDVVQELRQKWNELAAGRGETARVD